MTQWSALAIAELWGGFADRNFGEHLTWGQFNFSDLGVYQAYEMALGDFTL
jgi:hypothetical protein